MDGIINVLKPPGMSSHDVVYFIRRKMKIKKVGHTGTLDPNAAGVLPICIGQATKVSNYLLEDTKAYRAELTLGITTDTQDFYGAILSENPVECSEDEIREAMLSFMGEYNQLPPMYSALKVKGKKLYDYARQGIEIERESRRINIFNIDIICIKNHKVIFDVECSKGTYIRTLCHDIGTKLGCGGIMSFLIRTKSGEFKLEDSFTLESIKAHENPEELLIPTDFPLSRLPKIIIDESQRKLALNGGKINAIHFVNRKILPLPIETIVTVYLGELFIGLAKIQGIINEEYIKFTRLLV